MAKTDTQYIKVTLTGSVIGRIEPQKRTAKAMGLRRIDDSIVVPDNPAVRGMVRAISHLVRVEHAEAPQKRTKAADKRKAAALTETKVTKVTEETKVENKTEVKPVAEKPVAAKKPVEKKTAAAKPAAKKPAAAKAPAAKKATTPKKESK